LSLIPFNSSVFMQSYSDLAMYFEKVYTPANYNNQTVDYAIIDTVSYDGISAVLSGYSGYWANKFAHNRSYGIYESIQGIIIYKLHYSGTPVYYVPTQYNITYNLSFFKIKK
ncbi:MAG: hypothetical protein QXZ12_08445, partial [Thermoplasmata archaeon]